MRSLPAFLFLPTIAFHLGPSLALKDLPIPATHSPAEKLSPSFGFEATTGVMGLFESGLFYDQTLQVSSAPEGAIPTRGGSLSYYGGLIRAGVPFISAAFVDFKIGFTRSSFEQLRSNTSLGFGAGLGYRQDLSPIIQLSPRIGYRWLRQTFVAGPTSQAVSYLDLSLMVSIGI